MAMERIELDEQQRRWLVTPEVDLLLDQEPINYTYVGNGKIILTGGLLTRPVKIPLEQARYRLNILWAKRQAAAARLEEAGGIEQHPAWFDRIDRTCESLTKAFELAERYTLDIPEDASL